MAATQKPQVFTSYSNRIRKKRKITSSSKLKKFAAVQRLDGLEANAINFKPPEDLNLFSDLPLSDETKRGLKKSFFLRMTDIQIQSLPVSLKGKDVLGAARTGSGKTLAFLIPVLEILYRRRWGPTDGLGALVISPTRELAVQIFEVLRSIGAFHSFSAGLVIGGKNLKDESDRLSRMNILVATPGRLLQHMDQTVGFSLDNLQLLVLDEADRILDMGFYRTVTALLSHLPKSRQTLLFSATQTESVSDLARLSLQDPIAIGLDNSYSSIPQNLQQHYIQCPLDRKLDVLWGFIKMHLQCKVIVFLSSCKQVRFVFETFCKMQPGVPLLQLHGKQKQMARLNTYDKFTAHTHAVLFATDIAARGLDFPAIDWVVQVDTPEDAETYIHRVGRTARYESRGKALLFLLPSEEEGMLAVLKEKGIEVEMIKFRETKTPSIENRLQNLAFQNPEIKYLGQRAFISYLRSVHLHKDKSIFKLERLPMQRFAESLGLPGAPKVKFLRMEIANAKKNVSRTVSNGVRTKYDRMFERKNQGILSEHYSKIVSHNNSDSEEDFITLKRADHELSDNDDNIDVGHGRNVSIMNEYKPPLSGNLKDFKRENLSKRKLKLGRAKRAIATGGVSRKLVFDDDGAAHELYELGDADEWYKDRGGLTGAKEEGRRFAEYGRRKKEATDIADREEGRQKKREKIRKRKERGKEVSADNVEVILPTVALSCDANNGDLNSWQSNPKREAAQDDDVKDIRPRLKRPKLLQN